MKFLRSFFSVVLIAASVQAATFTEQEVPVLGVKKTFEVDVEKCLGSLNLNLYSFCVVASQEKVVGTNEIFVSASEKVLEELVVVEGVHNRKSCRVELGIEKMSKDLRVRVFIEGGAKNARLCLRQLAGRMPVAIVRVIRID